MKQVLTVVAGGPLAVADGALLSCNCGTEPTALLSTHAPGIEVEGKMLASVLDHESGSNIAPFGRCKVKPRVGGEFAPCVTVTPTPWSEDEFAPFHAVSVAVLGQTSVLACSVGGQIVIDSPGQGSVSSVQAEQALYPEQAEEGGGAAEEIFDFVIGDDIDSVINPDSPLDFVGGVVGLLPVGKLVKGGKLLGKGVNAIQNARKGSKGASRAPEVIHELPSNVTPNRIVERSKGGRTDIYHMNAGANGRPDWRVHGHTVKKDDEIVYNRTRGGVVLKNDRSK